MKQYIVKIYVVLCIISFCLILSVSVQASDNIETAGDVLLTIGTTLGLKYAIKEERPDGGGHSFPSAHASISFTSAEFIRKRYGWEYGLPAYAAALFVAYSRVEARKHYAHDVIAGAAIGIGSSYLFTREYEGWHMQAETDHKYYGMRLSHAW